jgi:hypothetical protein
VCLLQLLSSKFNSFHCRALSSLWLNLSLGILFFVFIVNEIVFIYIFENSLLVYSNASEFCMLILYHMVLLNSCILPDFWWNVYKIVSGLQGGGHAGAVALSPSKSLEAICVFMLPPGLAT